MDMSCLEKASLFLLSEHFPSRSRLSNVSCASISKSILIHTDCAFLCQCSAAQIHHRRASPSLATTRSSHSKPSLRHRMGHRILLRRVDILISIATCYYLRKSKGKERMLNSRISNLTLHYTLSCAVFTGACSTACLFIIVCSCTSLRQPYTALMNARRRAGRLQDSGPEVFISVTHTHSLPHITSYLSAGAIWRPDVDVERQY